jgi:hypothetical protein
MITAPNPHERIGQRLLEHATVAVAGCQAEDKTVVVTFGIERRFSAFAGHDPIVMSFFGVIWAKIVF